MIALWHYYWPVAVVALVIGVVVGAIAFRSPGRFAANRRGRALVLAGGIAAVLAAGAIWHGPAGTGTAFATIVERQARSTLSYYEMTRVQAELQRAPLRRTLLLSGPADEFQRTELLRIMGDLPGVAKVRWPNMEPRFQLPLLVEVELLALIGFGLGLLLSYLIEIRRRARAEWRW